MPRNFDITSLRSFVAVAESGGITRAAGFLNLTQSAVSMQIKRLEEMLGLKLFDRTTRSVSLTASGEQLLGYARRMIALNDEAHARITERGHEGEIVLGVPHDIVYPSIPQVLRQFNAQYPRVKVQLIASYTRELKERYERGSCDVILTTEDSPSEGGEALATLPLVWIGAQGGSAWKQRPLPLAFEYRCFFRQRVQAALEQAGIPWEMAVEAEQNRSIEAAVSADLAVHALLRGTEAPQCEIIPHHGALPDLGGISINLYSAGPGSKPALKELAEQLRRAFRGKPAAASAASAAC